VFFGVAFTQVYPADFWWHLRYGELILETGSIPATDPFTFTAQGMPYLYGYWLCAVLFAAVHQLAGIAGIVLLNALLFTGGFGLLLAACRTAAAGNLRAAAAGTLLAFAVSVENWTVRPQSLSVVCFAATWLLLVRYATGRGRARSLLGLPLVMLVWANVHGAFFLGLLLPAAVAMALAVQARRAIAAVNAPPPRWPLAAATGASLATAAFLTPFGVDRITSVLALAGNASVRAYALEWGPPSLDVLPGRVFAVAIAATLASLLGAHQRPPLWLVTSTVLICALGLLSLRGIVWAGMLLGTASAWALQESMAAGEARPAGPAARLGLCAALVAVGLLALPWWRSVLPLPPNQRLLMPADTPLQAADLLAAAHPQRVFADMQYASLLDWRLPSRNQVFIDPRFELFAPGLWERYGTISDGSAPGLLADYGVDAVLAHHERQAGLQAWLATRPDWQIAYRDDYSSVWIHTR